MDHTSSSSVSKKRKRGRPPKYLTPEAKAAADAARKRAARRDASFKQRDTAHINFYNQVLALQTAEISERVGISSGFYPPPVDAPEPDGRDISQFITTVDHQLEEDSEEQGIFDAGSPAHTADSDPIPNYESPGPDEAVTLDTPLEASSQTENDEPDPVGHLAQELAEQLIKFQGCCNDCHRVAKQGRNESLDEQISLATYLESTVGLGPDVLSCKTLASQKDDLAGKMSPESRKKVFCGLDSRAEVPQICLDDDERVSSGAGVTFDVDSILGFPSSLAVAKRGIRWSPTRMTVSDLQSDLHLRSIPVTYSDADGVQHQVHRPIHQVPHYTFGRVIGFEDISLYFLFPKLYRVEQKCSKLRDEDFRLWMDGILLPAIYQSYSSAHIQHYPSSYDHSRYNSTARGVETLTRHVHPNHEADGSLGQTTSRWGRGYVLPLGGGSVEPGTGVTNYHFQTTNFPNGASFAPIYAISGK